MIGYNVVDRRSEPLIYEQYCPSCDGDMVAVQEMIRIVSWCTGCGFRMESPELIASMDPFLEDAQ